MADVKITDLPLKASVLGTESIPTDDSIQTYRITPSQMKTYILANGNITLAMLADPIFSGLTAVTIAPDDYLVIADTSDSNKNKKALVSDIRNALYRSVTTTDTAVIATDEVLKLSGASFTQTLPTAVGNTGKRFVLIHAGTSLTQIYTLNTTSAQTIGGVASGSYKLNTFGESLTVVSDGANWLIQNHTIPDVNWSTTNTVIGSGGNPTKGTIVNDVVQMYRQGRFLCGTAVYAHSGGSPAAGSGTYRWTLPNSLVMDSSLIVQSSSFNGAMTLAGHGAISDASNAQGANSRVLTMHTDDTTHLIFRLTDNIAAQSNWVQGTSGQPSFASAAVNFAFDFKVPISGWQP